MSLDLHSIPPSQKRVLAGVAAVAAVAVVVMYVILPMNRKVAEANQKARDLNAQNDRSFLRIRNVPRLRAENRQLGDEVAAITNRFVMRPILGSYPMERHLFEIVGEDGFHVSSCREVGLVETPTLSPAELEKNKGKKPPKGKKGPPKPKRYLSRYKMEIQGEGRYADIVRLIKTLEEENPYFAVVSLRIVSNPRRPELHDVTLSLEWPVEAPDEAP